MTFLKHAQTAWEEGRVEDAAWLREKARDRWSQRKTVPDVPTADDVARALDRYDAISPLVNEVAGGRTPDHARIDAMRLLTLLRVSEKGHPVSLEAVMVLVRRLEEML